MRTGLASYLLIACVVAGCGNHKSSNTGTTQATGTSGATNTVAFTAAASTTPESAGALNVGVQLTTSGTLATPATVTVTRTGGTATDGTDHATVGSIVLTFPAGATNGTIQTASVNLIDDTLVEGSETLQLGLSSPSAGHSLGSTTTHTVTITDPIITTVSGTTSGVSGDNGLATLAQHGPPIGVAIDGADNFFVLDTLPGDIRRVDGGTGIITTLVSSGLNFPFMASADSAGDLYVSDTSNHRIVHVDGNTGAITVIAGTTGVSGSGPDNTLATMARLDSPYGVVVDGQGNVFIADDGNDLVRRVDGNTGNMTIFAGTGTGGFSGDGMAATSANLHDPSGLALDAAGNLYICDALNQRVRRVVAGTGIIETVAGSAGGPSFAGDNGPATSAILSSIRGIAIDRAGNLLIADTGNHCIRLVNAQTGIITTVAGTPTVSGLSGDLGLASAALLSSPSDLAIDSQGRYYIADQVNSRIRRVE